MVNRDLNALGLLRLFKTGVVQDFLRGIFKGFPDDRATLQTDIFLEAANFQKLRGWFASDEFNLSLKQGSK